MKWTQIRFKSIQRNLKLTYLFLSNYTQANTIWIMLSIIIVSILYLLTLIDADNNKNELLMDLHGATFPTLLVVNIFLLAFIICFFAIVESMIMRQEERIITALGGNSVPLAAGMSGLRTLGAYVLGELFAVILHYNTNNTTIQLIYLFCSVLLSCIISIGVRLARDVARIK